MKLHITKMLLAAGAIALTGCANHDLIPDITEVGQAVPAVYWEVGSTVCKAGESFTFQGKYTNQPDRTPLRSEVWYQIDRTDVASVTTKLAGAGLSYAKSVTTNETMRAFQCHASYPHQAEYWDGHQNIFSGEVPVSSTLAPVSWVDASQWDQTRFDTYYPAEFVEEYLNTVLDYLTSPASADSYFGALRTVYLNYEFTNEQFAAVGLPELDLSGDDHGAGVKSNTWYPTSERTDADMVGYYYTTLDAEGNVVYHEVGLDYEAPEGQFIYPVYEAPAWVFCRYDDNSGSIVSTVRKEWLPKFRTLLENIPFTAWIYDTANGVYKVDFARNYSLKAQFRSYDKDTNKLNDPSAPEYEGVVSPTEMKTISVN